MEENQTTISWDEALKQQGEFYKFEEGQRVVIAVQNWKIVQVEKDDFNDPSVKKIQPQFEADVVAEAKPNDEKAVKSEKRLSILSKRFMGAVRPFLEEKDPKSIVFLSVKKIGEKQNTTYDVERVDPKVVE